MSNTVPLRELLRALSTAVAESNVEMQTTQRMAWAESVAFYKSEAALNKNDDIKQIQSTVLSGWHDENLLAIKEVKLTFNLVERGFFSRLASLIRHPFSDSPPRYQLIPASGSGTTQNVEITFAQNKNGEWENSSNHINSANTDNLSAQRQADISVPIL